MLEFIAEQTSDVFVRIDRAGEITYVSPSIRAYGHSPAALVGTSGLQLFHTDDRAEVAGNVAALLQGQTVEATVRRYRFLVPDGGILWVEGNPRVVFDSKGEAAEIVSVFRNVTRHREVEEALRVQAELFEAAFTNAPVAMTMNALDGQMLRVNPACCRILGMDEAELLKLNTDDLSHPDEQADAAARVRRLLSGEAETYETERRFRRADGSYIWTQLAVSLVRNADGSPKHFISHAQDLTARREAEAALSESEARYRVIAEQTRDIIAMSDRDAKITYLSPSIRQLGFEPEDLLGKPFAPHVHPDDAALVSEILRRQRPGSPAERVRWRARHQITGRWVWLESVPTRLWNPTTGEPNGHLDIVRDITQQVRQEQALALARSEAEAAARVKSQFLANMSHEIRTPLTAVLGYSEILNATPDLNDEARAHVQRIAAGGSALLAIVNDILDFSKLEAGMVEVRLQPTDLAQVAGETLAMFEALAAARGLSLTLDLAPDLPARMMLDTDRLRQILVNLIGNALKFTERGRVVVRAAPTPDGGGLRLEVEDTGPGLDAEQCSRLFQRFNQIDGTTARRHGGTGLGLAICKGLTEAMGGKIEVTSTPGQGSIFYLTLPLKAADREVGPAAAAAEMVSIAGLRVLVVDDNATNRELARRILEALGADVTDADGGVEALGELMSLPVDVVLLDLRMPDMDGREVLTRMRAQGGPNVDVPVLAFTADADVGDSAGLGAFQGVVRKPIDALALAAGLAAAVTEREPEKAPTSLSAAR